MTKFQHGSSVAVFLAIAASLQAQQMVVLSQNTKLTTISAAAPGTPVAQVNVTGLQTSEKLLGIDFRPLTGQLYGLGSSSRLYTIDLSTGVATAVAGQFMPLLAGGKFGFDFNPTVDRIRITSDSGQNLRAHPVTGQVVFTDGALAYAAADPNSGAPPAVTASAYTNSVAGATATTLYDIDVELDVLVTQAPPNSGTLNTVGPLGVSTVSSIGFDINPMGNVGYASLTSPGTGVTSSNLFTINLLTGAASFIGTIGVFGKVDGLAIIPIGGTALTGNPETGCEGELGIGVTAEAKPGDAAYAMFLTRAPATADGVVFISDATLASPLMEGGVMVLIDIASAAFDYFPVASNPWGSVDLTLSIPNDPNLVGVTRSFQAAFVDTCAPGGVVVSPALSVTVMP